MFAALLPLAAAAAVPRPARGAERQLVFPQGSEQPLAALQDIDVVEHLGEKVPTGLAFADEAGRSVKVASLLGRGKPVLVVLGYHRCPMLCGLILDGLVKAGSASGLRLGKDYLAVDVSIDPAEDTKLPDRDPAPRARARGQGRHRGRLAVLLGRRRWRGGPRARGVGRASATSTIPTASSSPTRRWRSC